MAQTYTSANTSVNSGRLPAVYRKATFSAPFVLDYGCGKYTDHIREELHRQGRELFPYDPYNQPDEVNKLTMRAVQVCTKHRIPVDVVCSNVLNVIDDEDTLRFTGIILSHIAWNTGGKMFVTVYEGDRSGIGRQTGPDQYQRNAPLREYLKYFPIAEIRSGMITTV